MTSLRAILVAGLFLAASHSASAEAAELEPGAGDWMMVEPGGNTGCAFDTPFRFFHRSGDASRLLLYFEGGGACWNFVSCSGMFDTSVAEDELAGFRGIFNFADARNPFRDYTAVFVPYCSGDVHVGDAVRRYGDEEWDVRPVAHRGWANVSAVLDWIATHVSPPDRLVVAGASAGSYGAIFHAPRAATLFPSAELVVIGDSGIPLLHDYPSVLDGWGATTRLRDSWGQGRSGAPVDVTLRAAHEQIPRQHPDARIAHVTTDRDAIQSAFYLVSGSPRWKEATFELLGELEAGVPGFRAFVASGDAHGLLRSDQFYTVAVDGVRLRDWIDDLVEGRPVDSRVCGACRPGAEAAER